MRACRTRERQEVMTCRRLASEGGCYHCGRDEGRKRYYQITVRAATTVKGRSLDRNYSQRRREAMSKEADLFPSWPLTSILSPPVIGSLHQLEARRQRCWWSLNNKSQPPWCRAGQRKVGMSLAWPTENNQHSTVAGTVRYTEVVASNWTEPKGEISFT